MGQTLQNVSNISELIVRRLNTKEECNSCHLIVANQIKNHTKERKVFRNYRI